MAFLAPSLVALRNELNARYPHRDKASDGWIGDAAHSSRESDHNPDEKGMVHALDLDEDIDGTDDESGSELSWLAEHLRNKRDARIKYVIYEGHIFAGRNGPQPWVWRVYSGSSNLHTKHIHVSVTYDQVGEQNTSPWIPQGDWLDMATQAEVEAALRNVLGPWGMILVAELQKRIQHVDFVKDPDGQGVWLVWGTSWRWLIDTTTPEGQKTLSDFQGHWAARGCDVEVKTWRDADIDAIPISNGTPVTVDAIDGTYHITRTGV